MAIALMKMFWKSMYMPSKINTILEKEDATLEEILAEDDVIEECKSGNSKLLDFLTKDDNLEKLVNMLVDEPSSEIEERLKYKNAHQACEILTSDTTQITDALSNRDDLLSKIYSFFDKDPPINPLQASFFSKTMGLLITHKSEKMLSFFKSRPDFMDRLVDHLDTSAIADLLLRLVTCIDNVQCRNQCFQWLNEQQLVQRLVSLMDVNKSSEIHCNSSQSICDIIRLSREHQYQHQQHCSVVINGDKDNGVVAPDDVLLKVIECTQTVGALLDRALPDDVGLTNESLITNTILVLQTLLEPRKTSTTIFSIAEDAIISESDEDNKENELSLSTRSSNCNNNNEDVERIVSCIVSRLEDFFKILSELPKQRYNPMPSTLGLLSPPLGPSRLAIIRFFNALLTLRNKAVEDRLAELDAPSKIMSLFFEFPWNNFLHGEVEKLVFHCLNSSATPNLLLSKLLSECCLVEKLCEELEKYFKPREQSEEGTKTNGSRRPGYLGHLTSIANLLVNKFNTSPDLIQELSPELQSRWAEFASTTLENINKINNTDLGVGIGNERSRLSSSEEDEDDEDFRNIFPPYDFQKAFNNYQGQQLATDFKDNFGFTEDDFNEADEPIGSPFKDRISSLDFNLDAVEDSPVAAASFRQACQDRIQQFDRPNGEEEEEEEENWPPIRKQTPRLNLLEALQKAGDASSDRNRPSTSRSSEVKGRKNDQDEEEEEEEEGNDEDAADGDCYRNDRMREEELEDSEDDLDSPAIIRQMKTTPSDEDSTNRLSTSVDNNHNDGEDDDDYESLQEENASVLDASFVGGDDDDAAGDVKVNGLANDEKATEVGEAGDSSTLLNLNQVALKIGRIARDAGDAEDAGSAGLKTTSLGRI